MNHPPLLRLLALSVLLLSFMALPGHGQRIEVRGNSKIIVPNDNTPSTTDGTDFGEWGVLENGGVARTFDIFNTSTSATLRIYSIQPLGPAAAEFRFTVIPALVLPPRTATSFELFFKPDVQGERDVTLRINCNDPTLDPHLSAFRFDFAIQGTGTIPEPRMSVTGNGQTIPDGDPLPSPGDHTDFGTTDVGDGSVTHTFTIENVGTAPLSIAGLQFFGGESGDFTFTKAPSNGIPIDGSSTFEIRFDPSSSGLRSTTVQINSNDASHTIYDFKIQGTGSIQAPEIQVSGNGQAIASGDLTPSFDDHTLFGNVEFAGVPVTRHYLIANSGQVPLTIDSIDLIGSERDDFELLATPGGPIAPAGTMLLPVRFTPRGEGVRGTTVRINSNANNASVFEFAIQGVGGNFRLLRIEADGDDALVVFRTNPDPSFSQYFYTLQFTPNPDTTEWEEITIGNFEPASTEQLRHEGILASGSGFWRVVEVLIP